MSIFGKLFGRNSPQPTVDVSIWKTGPAMVGAMMLSQFMRGDRLLLSDDQLAVIVNKAHQNERSNVELWASMYVSWLLLVLAKAEYGDEFGRETMAAVYGRIATSEDKLPGIEAIADGLKHYFKKLDQAVQHAIKNPAKIKGQDIPPVFFIALAFLTTDERFAGQTDPDFNGFDLELATYLAEAQDASKPRLDWILSSAASLPR